MTTSNQLATSQPPIDVVIIDGSLTTTSLDIARHFGKQHWLVLRAIRSLLPQLPEGYGNNFVAIQIDVDFGQNRVRKEPAYRITRDGFTLLGMSFTGPKALHFKLAYIDAFNAMEKTLVAQTLTAQAYQKIEWEYAENLKHHPNYELGETLKEAIRSENYDSVAEIDKVLDKMDFKAAARVEGLPTEVIRRKVAIHTAATLLLGSMARGEHQAPSPVRSVVEWARTIVNEEDARAKMLSAQRAKPKVPMTHDEIIAYDLSHKHDKPVMKWGTK